MPLTPVNAPPVDTLKPPLLVSANVPVALPMAVLAVPVVLMLVVPIRLIVPPLCSDILPAFALPIATVPVLVPVLMVVLKLLLSFKDMAAPEIVAPRLPVNSCDTVSAPALVVVTPVRPSVMLVALVFPRFSTAAESNVRLPLVVVKLLAAPPVTVTPAPLCKANAPADALPMLITPVLVPVPMLVVLAPLALMLVAPVTVKPPVPCNKPVPLFTPTAVIAPALLTVKLVLLIRLVKVPLKLKPLVAVLLAEAIVTPSAAPG